MPQECRELALLAARYHADIAKARALPVASLLCPPRLRPAVLAIYGFARTADDLADEGKATAQSHIHGPDVLLEAAETENIMQQAIATLEEDQRLLVVLRDVEELSYEEIVEITGLPEGTVKSRLHRARMTLKQLLEDKFK